MNGETPGPRRGLCEAHVLWAIFLLALAIRLALNADPAARLLRIPRAPRMDSCVYDTLATNLLRGYGFGLEPPDASYVPLFPLYVAAVYFFFGHSYLALAVANAVVSSLGCVFTYLLGRDLVSRRVGALAALLAIGGWRALQFVPRILTETPTLTLATFAAWWLVRTRRQPTPRRQAVLGALSGLLLLLRAQMLGFVAVAGLLAAAAEAGWRRRLRALVLGACAAALVLSPWWVRNWLVLGDFVPLSRQAGGYLAATVLPGSRDGLPHLPGDPNTTEAALLREADSRLEGLSESERAQLGYQRLAAFVREQPLLYLKFIGFRLLAMCDLLPFDYFTTHFTWKWVAKRTLYFGILALAFAGMAFDPPGRRRAAGCLALVAGYLLPLAMLGGADSRYLLPVEPLLWVPAARMLEVVVERMGRRDLLARLFGALDAAPPASAPSRPAWLAGTLLVGLFLAAARIGVGTNHARIRIPPPAAQRLLDRPCTHEPHAYSASGPRVEFRATLSDRPALPEEVPAEAYANDPTYPPEAFRDRFWLAYSRRESEHGPATVTRYVCLAGVRLPDDLREDEVVRIRGCVLAHTNADWIQAHDVTR
ncbi:MAG: glycosyltransferase family 39 protein [Planctomycetes bacterium]|nr:glycosyltransferase family 39 protein [Planctomycetota bacterium]